MNPTVSVIIPVFNGADLVVGAVESALEQTLPAHEIIVIDDASEDRDALQEGLGDWIAQGRLRLIEMDQNRGPAAARNRGIREATGEFLAFLDADDRYEPERLEAAIDMFRNHPDTAMTCSDGYIVRDGVLEDGLKNDRWRPIAEVVTFERLLMQNCAYTLSVTLRRSVFDELGPFNEARELIAVEDYDLWLRVAHKYPVRYIDRPLGRYMVHSGSLSADTRRIFDGVCAILKQLEKDLPDFRDRYGATVDKRVFDMRTELAATLAEKGDRTEARREAWRALKQRPFSMRSYRILLKAFRGRR